MLYAIITKPAMTTDSLLRPVVLERPIQRDHLRHADAKLVLLEVLHPLLRGYLDGPAQFARMVILTLQVV